MLLRPNFGALGVILVKKALHTIVQKKVTPLTETPPYPRQEAPGQAATIKNCSSKKQLFEHMLKQLFEFLSENVDLAEN